MLRKITIKDFKSYREGDLPLAPLTVMIGANASGKSNAIEGLRLLSWLAQGRKLSEIRYSVQDSERVVRGRLTELGYLGSEMFGLGCETELPEWNRFSIEISIRNDELHITAESISERDKNVPLYILDQPAKGLGSDVGVAFRHPGTLREIPKGR